MADLEPVEKEHEMDPTKEWTEALDVGTYGSDNLENAEDMWYEAWEQIWNFTVEAIGDNVDELGVEVHYVQPDIAARLAHERLEEMHAEAAAAARRRAEAAGLAPERLEEMQTEATAAARRRAEAFVARQRLAANEIMQEGN